MTYFSFIDVSQIAISRDCGALRSNLLRDLSTYIIHIQGLAAAAIFIGG